MTGPTAYGYTQDDGQTTVTSAYAAGPDGTQTATRASQIPVTTPTTPPASSLAQWFWDVPPGTMLTYSEWLGSTGALPGSFPAPSCSGERATTPITGRGPMSTCQGTMGELSREHDAVVFARSSSRCPLDVNGETLALAPAFQAWGWCGDLFWAGVDSNVYAVDQIVDLVQAEPGYFATEPIVTGAATATRAGDQLQITSGADAVDGGQLSLSLKMYPKGDAVTCPASVLPSGARSTACAPGYTAPAYFFYIDGNNYGFFNAQDQSVTLAVAGTLASSSLGALWPSPPSSGPPPPTAAPSVPIFRAGQLVEWFIRAGAGAGLVQYRVNGGPIATLLDSPLPGSLAPAGSIDLLSAGTANQFSAWLVGAGLVYQHGQVRAHVAVRVQLVRRRDDHLHHPGRWPEPHRDERTRRAIGAHDQRRGRSHEARRRCSQARARPRRGVTTGEADYGTAFHGITQMILTTDGTTLSGSINGRALVPTPLASPTGSLQFADNGPAPTMQCGLEHARSAVPSQPRAIRRHFAVPRVGRSGDRRPRAGAQGADVARRQVSGHTRDG